MIEAISNRMTEMRGCTMWLTERPGTGKTTRGRLFAAHLPRLDLPVETLSGAEVRQRLIKE